MDTLNDEQEQQLADVISGLEGVGVYLPKGNETWTLAEWEVWLSEVLNSIHDAISGTSVAYEFQGAHDIVQGLLAEVQ